jgi:glucokinase
MISKSSEHGRSVEYPQPTMYILAFDVGGSHISGGLCELGSLNLVSQSSSPLPNGPGSGSFVECLYRLAREVIGDREKQVVGASLAIPGPFDYAAGVSYMRHKLRSLYGVDLRAELAQRFGWQRDQFRFLNDAGAFLLGEVHAGVAQGAHRAIGLTLGTGIGSAFAVCGHLMTDGEGVPPGGEIWNIPYLEGTVEDLLSTRALTSSYAGRTGHSAKVIEIAARVSSDVSARQVFEAFGLHLGEIVRTILAPFAPDVVIIGGGISRAADLYLPSARQQFRSADVHLVASSLFDRAPLIGAARFWCGDKNLTP